MKKFFAAATLILMSSGASAESVYWQLYNYKLNYYGELTSSREWCMQQGKQNGWKPDEYTCLMVKK